MDTAGDSKRGFGEFQSAKAAALKGSRSSSVRPRYISGPESWAQNYPPFAREEEREKETTDMESVADELASTHPYFYEDEPLVGTP